MSTLMNPFPPSDNQRVRGRWWKAPVLSGALMMVASGALASTEFSSGILTAGTHDIYYKGEVISASGMSNLRGGFNIAGLDLNFGAKLTTMINDRVRYITQIAFDNAGARVVSRTLEQSGTGPETVSPVSSAGGNGNIIGGQLNLDGLSDFSGILLSAPNGGGMTAALHNVTRKAIISTLSTTASGQNISNQLDISVHLNNIGEVKASRQRSRVINSLQGMGLPR